MVITTEYFLTQSLAVKQWRGLRAEVGGGLFLNVHSPVVCNSHRRDCTTLESFLCGKTCTCMHTIGQLSSLPHDIKIESDLNFPVPEAASSPCVAEPHCVKWMRRVKFITQSHVVKLSDPCVSAPTHPDGALLIHDLSSAVWHFSLWYGAACEQKGIQNKTNTGLPFAPFSVFKM